MDVTRYKCPTPRLVRLGEGRPVVPLAPLSRMAIDRAQRMADMRFLDEGLDPAGDHLLAERMLQVVAESAGADPRELGGKLHHEEIGYLYSRWAAIQDESIPDYKRLKLWCEKRVNDSAGIYADGLAAYLVDKPSDFYGVSPDKITHGQVMYYLAAKAAFREYHVEGGNKKVSRKWLESE